MHENELQSGCLSVRELERVSRLDATGALQDRSASHARTCPTCARLLEEVRRNLELAAGLDLDLDAVSVAPTLPARIGRYEIVRELGRGGMGTVYLARQPAPDRQVALKVIQPWLLSEGARRRFEVEVEILGRLSHPAIGRIYEAGLGGEGQPFYAMEYIEGPPIDAYLRERSAGTPELLRLFAEVCEAVHHAHVNGVIHRDLKPGNVLVDPSGQPKVIDFGIARVADYASGESVSVEGSIVGTLQYMSPEQLDGPSRALDTRSDIYSLGALLYELLTGRSHLGPRDLPLLETVRRIQEGHPLPPDRVNRSLPPDLGWITVKCLAHDPAERYSSAAELAADLRRWLGQEAVLAGPQSPLYRLGKHLKRRRRSAIAGLAVTLLVASLGTWAVRENRRAREEAWRASIEADAGASVLEFAEALYELNDPKYARVRQRSGGAFLDEELQRIAAALAKKPSIEATVLQIAGNIYVNAESYGPAAEVLSRALATAKGEVGPRHRLTLAIMTDLGIARRHAGDLQGAAAILEAQRDLLTSAPERAVEEVDALVRCRIELGSVYKDRRELDRASGEWREALRLGEIHLDPAHPRTVVARGSLALLQAKQGNFFDAEAAIRESLRETGEAYGPDNVNYFAVQKALADLYVLHGRPREAAPLLSDALAGFRKSYGDVHGDTVEVLNSLGGVLVEQGRLAEAAELYDSLLESYRPQLPYAHGNLLAIAGNRVQVALRQGDLTEARDLAEDVVAGARRHFGAESPSALKARATLCGVLVQTREYDRAEEVVQVLEACGRLLAEEDPIALHALFVLGQLRLLQREHEESERIFRELLRLREAGGNPLDPDALAAQRNLGRLLSARGEYAEAEQLIQAALEGARELYGEGHTEVFVAMASLGALRQRQSRFEEARELLLAALEGVRGTFRGSDYQSGLWRRHLTNALVQSGRMAEAEDFLLRDVEQLRGQEDTPAYVRDQALLGELYLIQGRTLLLQGKLEEGSELLGRSESLLQAAVQAQRTRSRPDGLLADYLRTLGHLRVEQNRTEEAARAFEEVLELFDTPGHPADDAAAVDALLGLGIARHQLGDLEGAHARTEAALERMQGDAGRFGEIYWTARYNQASFLLKLDRRDEAIAILQESARSLAAGDPLRSDFERALQVLGVGGE